MPSASSERRITQEWRYSSGAGLRVDLLAGVVPQAAETEDLEAVFLQ